MTPTTPIQNTQISHAVLWWLMGIAALITLIVLVGGATRLTDSGLSITEWKPIMGAVPPLSAADWQTAFAKYKLIPEYTEVNAGMSLADFKFIFWWEWGHRFLGRLIGVFFLVPFVWFLLRGEIPVRLRLPLLGMFVLGGFQGALGWYMVKSGLAGRVDVSQYRLAAHLGLAVLIYLLLVRIILREGWGNQPRDTFHDLPGWVPVSAMGITGAVFLQILSGAFVAGMRAGLSHNTWPLMDGRFIPDGLFLMSPAWSNLFENIMTVQFNHRMLAYGIVLWTLVHVVVLLQQPSLGGRRSALWLGGATLAQVVLGIVTLVNVVPIHLGLAHQAGALVLLTVALVHWHAVHVRQG